MKTKIQEQVKSLSSSSDAFLQCVAAIPEELFVKSMNGWSPRDVVAHLIGWSRYAIQGSRQIVKGELPFYDLDPGENYSKVNDVLIRTYSSTDQKTLLGELQSAVKELEDFLQTLDPQCWDHDYGVRHKGLTVTIRNSIGEVIEDYDHHRAQIEHWISTRAT